MTVSTRHNRGMVSTTLPVANPFREAFEEDKQVARSVQDTSSLTPPVNTPPSYLENRTAYTRTPNSLLRKRLKLQQMPQRVFPFSRDSGGGSIALRDAIKSLPKRRLTLGSAKSRAELPKVNNVSPQTPPQKDISQCCCNLKGSCTIV